LERKLSLVKEHRGKYWLNRCLAALGVSKSTWHRHQRPKVSQEDEELKAKVLKVVEEHPACGYRRIKVEFVARFGTVVNHKRLRRLLREMGLGPKERGTPAQAQRGEEDPEGGEGEAQPACGPEARPPSGPVH